MDKKEEAAGLKIAAVERETGLGKDTLRVWERRYGFPAPVRDALGERCYSSAEVDKLRVVKRLLDAGHRPGALMPLSVQELQQLGQRSSEATLALDDAAANEELSVLLDLLRTHDLAGLRRRLSQAQVRLGLIAFVSEVIAPLNKLVGQAWARGDLNVYQEHSYTETVQRVLRTAIQGLNVAGDELRPKLQNIKFDLEGAKNTVKYARPFTSCPYGPNCAAECSACRGRGWVSKETWDRTPENIRNQAISGISEVQVSESDTQSTEAQVDDIPAEAVAH